MVRRRSASYVVNYAPSTRHLIYRLEHLLGTCAGGRAVGQVHPTDDAAGINQEFGRPGDVSPVRSCAGMQKIITPCYLGVRVGKQGVSKSKFLGVLTQHLDGIRADADDPDAAGIEFGKPSLKTPQL